MLMSDFVTAVQYKLPLKVAIIKNNTLGMIQWEQMAYLVSPEFGVEFTQLILQNLLRPAVEKVILFLNRLM
jgi:pyruvate dehydrogenase (quinone)/pyruvate oxidase